MVANGQKQTYNAHNHVHPQSETPVPPWASTRVLSIHVPTPTVFTQQLSYPNKLPLRLLWGSHEIEIKWRMIIQVTINSLRKAAVAMNPVTTHDDAVPGNGQSIGEKDPSS